MKLKTRETLLITLLLVSIFPIILLSLANYYVLKLDTAQDSKIILNSSVDFITSQFLEVQNNAKNQTDNLSLVIDHINFETQNFDYQNLLNLLERLRESTRLDKVLLLDNNKKILAMTKRSEDLLNTKEFDLVYSMVLKGKEFSYIDQLKTQPTNSYNNLLLINISPVYQNIAIKKNVLGAVMTAKTINIDFFRRMVVEDPIIDINMKFGHITEEEKNDSYIKSIPLLNYNNKKIVDVILWYEPENIRKVFGDTQVNSLYIALIVICIVLGITFILSNKIVKPLEALSDAIKQVSKEDFDVVVDVKGPVEIELLNNYFNKMTGTLAEKRRIQEDFISTLTHDMRVPLLGEKKALELLINDDRFKLSDDQTLLIENMSSSNKDLLKLVNTLLDTYKLDAGKYTLSLDKINVVDLLNELFSELTPLANEKDQELILNIPEQEIIAHVDRYEIKRMLRNIISNAIKFTQPKGLIEISIKNILEENALIISIADNGPGISKEMKEQLFQRYASGSKKLKKVGTGLGLYLSYRIVLAHHGSLEAFNREEQGTVFHITLPKDNQEVN